MAISTKFRICAFAATLMVLVAGAVTTVTPEASATRTFTTIGPVPIPAAQVGVINNHANACPTLSRPRLAALVMATSGFNLADPNREITALAHRACELSGEVRLAGLPGDIWQLVVAAYHSGFAAVRAARGVPAGAVGFVNTVVQYSDWYANNRRALTS